MEDNAILLLIFILWMIAWVGGGYILRRRRSRRKLGSPPECTVFFNLVRINPSSISGNVRISEEMAKKADISSGIEARMFRTPAGRLLPGKGYGEKRALPVMISVDDSLAYSELVVSMEDARTLNLGRGGTVMLRFTMQRPPKVVTMNAYQGKIPVIGVRSPRVIAQPKGPHKVRISSKIVEDSGDSGSRE